MRNSISIGDTFGKWTVVDRAARKNGIMWLCECECGVRKPVRCTSLLKGTSKSCGCSRGKTYDSHSHKQYRKSKYFSELNGLSKHPLYDVWNSMKYRCYDPEGSYFGTGRTICGEWKDNFLNFYDWALNNGYQEGLTIDRINNNGNYEPSNCRWVTYTVQNNNTSRSLPKVFYNGENRALSELSEQLGMKYSTLYCRIYRYGWSIEKAISTPVNK